jgi:hypothetical protein
LIRVICDEEFNRSWSGKPRGAGHQPGGISESPVPNEIAQQEGALEATRVCDAICSKQEGVHKYIRHNVEFKAGSMTHVPIEGEHIFDVIVCVEAIEHIDDHEKLLKEVKTVGAGRPFRRVNAQQARVH